MHMEIFEGILLAEDEQKSKLTLVEIEGQQSMDSSTKSITNIPYTATKLYSVDIYQCPVSRLEERLSSIFSADIFLIQTKMEVEQPF